MKALVAIVLVCLLLVAIGAMYFYKEGDKVGVTVDTGKVEQAAEEAVDQTKRVGRDVAGDVGKALEKAGENLREDDNLEQPAESSKARR